MSLYLVIAPQGLGDSLEATPMLSALRACDAAAIIDVAVTRPGPRELFAGLPEYVRDVIYLPYWEKGRWHFLLSLVRNAWRRKYDATFLSYPAARPEYQLLSRAFRSRRRFAHRYFPPTVRSLLWLNSDLVAVAQSHNVLRNIDLLHAYGFVPPSPTSYVVPSAWKASAREFDRNRVAVHVGSIKHDGLEARRWPLENFVKVCEHLVEGGFDVALVMGPDEREETAAVHRCVPQTRIFEGCLSDVARFLSASRVVITSDTGIGHLSVGVGATVISLFGPTPLDYAPFGPSAVPLRPSECRPCFDARTLDASCKLNIDYACLKRDLTVDLVCATVDRLLAHAS